ncbi:Protein IMPACT, partial [Ophiophagus hannah]
MVAAAASSQETTQIQTEEIEALSAIYGDEWCTIDEDEKIFYIKISDCSAQLKWTLNLQVILPPEHPTSAPPIYQLNAPLILQKEYAELANHLEEIYVQNLGESILYLWVEKIREVLIEKSQSSESVGPDNKKITEETDVDYEEEFALEYQPLVDCTAIMLNFDMSEKKR